MFKLQTISSYFCNNGNNGHFNLRYDHEFRSLVGKTHIGEWMFVSEKGYVGVVLMRNFRDDKALKYIRNNFPKKRFIRFLTAVGYTAEERKNILLRLGAALRAFELFGDYYYL